MTLLLDTCAIIWLGTGQAMTRTAMETLQTVPRILVSPISAWEIGLASRRLDRRGAGLDFAPDVRTWFARFIARQSAETVALNTEIALDAAILPGTLHNDPADRLLIATARILDAAIVTRDRKILAYAEAGHVRAVSC